MRRRDPDRDRGAALVLVLVLVVIASLMVVPMMSYAVATMRANEVTRARRVESEAVKAGLRAALAEPATLFDACTGTAPVTLDLPTTADVITTCAEVGPAVTETTGSGAHPGDHETWVGTEAPAGYTGSPANAWSSTTQWQSSTAVWRPDVPTDGLVARTAPSPAACRVFYPGAYSGPISITGPAYFASGVYSLAGTLTIGTGADVVAGAGPLAGCSTDAAAAAGYGSAGHGIDGLGATFVLTGAGRIVVSDGSGDLRFVINPRYGTVGTGLSIATVNGTSGAATLTVPGHLDVPATGGPADASSLTPHPREPYPPTAVSATGGRVAASNHALAVRWSAPTNPTGATILQYTATATPGGASCTTSGPLGCVISGLASAASYSVTVAARNANGWSAGSTPATQTAGGALFTAPGVPTNVTLSGASLLGLVYVTPYEDALVVNWSAPASDGGAPITGYTASAALTLDAELVGVALPTGWVTSLPGLGGLLGLLLGDATSALTSSIVTYLDGIDGTTDGKLAFPDARCQTDGTTYRCAIPTDAFDLLMNLTAPGVCTLKVLGACVSLSGPVNLTALLPNLLTNLLAAGVLVNVTATNAMGTSPASAPVLAGVNLLGCQYLVAAPAGCGPAVTPTTPYAPTPVIDIDVDSGTTVDIPGYVAVPQGVVRADIDSTAGVTIDGGVLAAYTEITGACTAGCRTTFAAEVVQRTLRITSRQAGSAVVSDARVQVNANGAWAINAWVVQPGPSTAP